MHKVIQKRASLCAEVAVGRRDAGLSQQALADMIGVSREKVARIEAGSGSVVLLMQIMAAVPMRLHGIAKGLILTDQLVNARIRRGWSQLQLAQRCDLDVRTVQQIERGNGTVASLEAMLGKLAPRWERQPVARIFWDFDRSRMAETDCRFTPTAFLDAVTGSFGPIDLDPCWHPSSNVIAARTISLPQCGLASEWGASGLVFMNPPYSNIASWIAKANREWEAGNTEKILILFPASRLDIREFFDRTSSSASTLILRERLRFERLEGKGYPAPFALALACLGCSDEELARFTRRYPALIIPPRGRSSASYG